MDSGAIPLSEDESVATTSAPRPGPAFSLPASTGDPTTPQTPRRSSFPPGGIPRLAVGGKESSLFHVDNGAARGTGTSDWFPFLVQPHFILHTVGMGGVARDAFGQELSSPSGSGSVERTTSLAERLFLDDVQLRGEGWLKAIVPSEMLLPRRSRVQFVNWDVVGETRNSSLRDAERLQKELCASRRWICDAAYSHR